MSQRSDNIRFKILPDGNIRAYQAHKGKCGASEWYLTTTMGGGIANTHNRAAAQTPNH